eukprot:350959_1
MADIIMSNQSTMDNTNLKKRIDCAKLYLKNWTNPLIESTLKSNIKEAFLRCNLAIPSINPSNQQIDMNESLDELDELNDANQMSDKNNIDDNAEDQDEEQQTNEERIQDDTAPSTHAAMGPSESDESKAVETDATVTPNELDELYRIMTQHRNPQLQSWGVNTELLKSMRKDGVVLHPRVIQCILDENNGKIKKK